MVYAQPVSVQENETHKIIWDFEIQTAHLISVRGPDLIIINKKQKKKKKKKKKKRKEKEKKRKRKLLSGLTSE